MNDNNNISDQRKDYQAGRFIMSALCDDPFEQFKRWLDEAISTEGIIEPTAMNLATYSNEQGLSSRMVLLKGVDERGFVFFTN